MSKPMQKPQFKKSPLAMAVAAGIVSMSNMPIAQADDGDCRGYWHSGNP